jgi:Holliday junction resolvase
MGKKSKRKGYRIEHNIEKILREEGITAKRIPLSGASWMKGDIFIELLNKGYVGEVKARKEGFKEIYKWLDGKDFLFLRADRKDFLIVMNIKTFLELINGDKGNKNN